jgi:uncharacterized protein YndB with AHSA1/START domain
MTDAANDLILSRVLDAPRDKLWRCWVEPELLKQWFCPKPWYVSEARIDLRPGGEFFTLMNGPDGERFGEPGVFLEVVEKERLVFTDAFRPATPRAPCTGAPRRAKSTRRWASTRAGARPPISSKPLPRRSERDEENPWNRQSTSSSTGIASKR